MSDKCRLYDQIRGAGDSIVTKMLAKRLRKFDEKVLSTKLKALMRWRTFASENYLEGAAVFAPTAAQLAEYCEQRGSGGPTAARGVFSELSFWHDYVGMPIPVGDELLKGYTQVEPGHVIKQAVALQVETFIQIIQTCIVRSTGSVNTLLRLVVAVAVACVRFKHAQISYMTRTTNRLIYWHCPQGKSSRGGYRPPFDFATPRCVWPGRDILGPVVELHEQLKTKLGRPGPFMIPDIRLNRDGSVDGDSPFLPKPMAYDKFGKLLQGVLGLTSLDAAAANKATTYMLRRFLPTVCDAVQADPEEQQAV